MMPWETLGLCCAHIVQLMAHPALYILPFTLQLCYKPLVILQSATKNQNVHTTSHDELQKLHNFSFAWHKSQSFLREGVEKQELPPSLVTFLKKKQSKILSLEFESLYTILNEEQGGSWASHAKTHCGHSCSNKSFQILLTSDFHRLADDAN